MLMFLLFLWTDLEFYKEQSCERNFKKFKNFKTVKKSKNLKPLKIQK